jgi:hypothetical protein
MMTAHQVFGENRTIGQIANLRTQIKWRLEMKGKHVFFGIVSLVAAGILVLLDVVKIEPSFAESIATRVQIYPAAFLGLLGLVLLYVGLKPLWRS